jgi:hypothetical protein
MTMARKRTLTEERRRTAFHEAGHAVLMHLFKQAIRSVTMKPNRSYAGLALVAGSPRPYQKNVWVTTQEECDHYSKDGTFIGSWGEGYWAFKDDNGNLCKQEEQQISHSTILIDMAGPIAEVDCCGGKINWSDPRWSGDRKNVEEALATLEDQAKEASYYERRTLALVRKHKKQIKRVANALIERETLTGAEVDQLIGPD